MDNPLYAMLFAESLIEECLERLGLTRPSPYSVIPHRETIVKCRLTPEIVEAVMEIILEQTPTINDCYAELLSKNVRTKHEFRTEMCIPTVYYFPHGYTHVKFLHLCALLVGLSIYYGQEDNFEIADAAAQVLAYVVNFFIYMMKFDPRCSWFELSYVAQKVRKAIRPKDSATV